MKSMLEVIADLTPLNRVFCSSDYDRAIDYVKDLLPFSVIEYHCGDIYNGWVIPPKWDVREAKILHDGEVVFDGTQHPLAVIALSVAFRGRVDLTELKKHLHYDRRYEDAIPFHFRQLYRSWDRDWGFCVPKRLYDALKPGMYDVVIETEESDGNLKVLEYTHRGSLPETFAFVAHLDHPGMANDDAAGCAVGIELFRNLSQRKTKFSYKLLLVQEIIGSEYYLGKTNSENRERILEALFIEMLGSATPLALQESLTGKSNVDHAVERSLKSRGSSFRRGPYRSIVGNDEFIWEGYGIPMASLSRFPYPEYHCDRDDSSIISEDALNESLDVLLRTVDLLESSRLVIKKFSGTICLSNPKFSLYVDEGQGAFTTCSNAANAAALRLLADLISTLQEPRTITSLSEQAGIAEDQAAAYLERWVQCGLLELK